MLIDGSLHQVPPHEAGTQARDLEEMGFSGVWASEANHVPFLQVALATQMTGKATLGTSIAVAFSRNPMLLAYLGWDLQQLSSGRFVLGLGSQVSAHITRRFSMPWSKPAARMRELVLGVRAIWDTWLTDAPLDFRGDFYQHTLMTPFFSPEPEPMRELGLPRIFLAGVGERMTEVAGEVADGFFCHAFTTVPYLRKITLPALERGAAAGGKTLADLQIRVPAFVATGVTDDEIAAAITGVRRQIAFYASTPAYRGVLEMHGWEGLQPELTRLSWEGKWAQMGHLIDDDVFDAFAVAGAPADIADQLMTRYGGAVQRLSLNLPYPHERTMLAPIVADLVGRHE